MHILCVMQTKSLTLDISICNNRFDDTGTIGVTFHKKFLKTKERNIEHM